MADRETEVGAAELEVLRALWEVGPATVREVMNYLHGRGRKLAYTTVLTFLSRLEQKGFVAADKREIAYVYRAKVSRDSVSRSRTKKLVEQLFDGAAGALVLQLVRTEQLSEEEIEELQRLVEGLSRGKRS